MKNQKGLSFLDVLGLIFIVLKFTNNIHWSWLWVLSPVIINYLIDFIFFVYIEHYLKTYKYNEYYQKYQKK
jgi:hypothetical protein